MSLRENEASWKISAFQQWRIQDLWKRGRGWRVAKGYEGRHWDGVWGWAVPSPETIEILLLKLRILVYSE